jgi:trk system potassium uptake protein TrkA
VRDGNPLVGNKLSEIYTKFQIKVLVCAVQRGQDVSIPDGEFVIRAGDKLHIAASHKEIEQFFERIGNRKKRIKNVLICGGGRVGYYLARNLCTMGMQVKMIELNRDKCEFLCEQLPEVTVIHGDATDHDLLLEEGVREADAFIALTGMDEENIIMGLFAKREGVHKIVAKVNEDSRAQMVDGMGLDSVVSAKTATADAIFSYVRARQNSLASANVEAMYRLVDDRVEALEFVVKGETNYTNVPLKDMKIKANNLIACIGRNRKIIIPSGNDFIRVGDTVVVVTKSRRIQDIADILG